MSKFEIETDLERPGNAIAGAVLGGLFFFLATALAGGFLLGWTGAPLVALATVGGVLGGVVSARVKALRILFSLVFAGLTSWH